MKNGIGDPQITHDLLGVLIRIIAEDAEAYQPAHSHLCDIGKEVVRNTPGIITDPSGLMGAYGIDRGGADLAAVKATLTYLKSGTSVIVFPEGTRVRPGKTVEPKTGAAMLAMRAGVPILPVYITQRKRPFCPIRLVFGEPYTPEIAGKRPTAAELEAITADLMERIYRMEAAA